MLIDNVDQHFVNCVLNSDKGSYYLEKWAYENFPWFPGFEICSMVKNENPETPKIDRKLSKLIKDPVLTVYHY